MVGILDKVLGAQQAAQQAQLGRVQLEQAQAAFPIQQQLSQLNLQRAQMTAPLEQQRLEQQVIAGQQAQQARQRQLGQADLQILGKLGKRALQEEDEDIFNSIISGGLQRFGLDTGDAPITREQVESFVAQSQAFEEAPAEEVRPATQKGRTVLVNTPEGLAFATSTFDPSTGQGGTTVSAITGNLVSSLGETREQQIESRVQEAESKALGAGLSKVSAASIGEKIANGLQAADSTAVLRRSLSLLDEIQTGGIDAVKLRAKQFVGAEGADEAELVFSLAKNVLQQLKPTFGAAFTKSEKDSLERIEAGIGKSTAGNIRLVEQALKIADRASRRGISAAEKGGERFDFERQEILDALEFNLAPEAAPTSQAQGQQPIQPQAAPQQAPQAPEGATAVNPQTGERLIFRGGQWQTI